MSAIHKLVLQGLELDIELAITNPGDRPFDFTAALHSYFLLDDLRRATKVIARTLFDLLQP